MKQARVLSCQKEKSTPALHAIDSSQFLWFNLTVACIMEKSPDGIRTSAQLAAVMMVKVRGT